MALIVDMEADKQQLYWQRILQHIKILETYFLTALKFDKNFKVSDAKLVSAVYLRIDSRVSIHNKSSWRTAMEFLNETMLKFEAFYNLYENTIKN